jgi:hypothetical protein
LKKYADPSSAVAGIAATAGNSGKIPPGLAKKPG